jgi:hypothetical protein
VSLLVAGLLVAASWGASPAGSVALYSDARTLADTTFTGATLTPNPVPAPSALLVGSAVMVEWGKVTSSSGGSVEYEVRRSGSDGSNVGVCADPSSFVHTGTNVSCTDTSVTDGVTFSYTVQARLARSGATTWTGIVSAASNPVSTARVRFAGAGELVTSVSSEVVTVPYPSGTEPGDLVFLVVETGRNKAPSKPSGWNVVASRSIVGSEDFHLFLAQRIADASGSVTVNVDGRNGGIALRVFRYDVPTGWPVPAPVVTADQDAASASASLTFAPSPDLVATASGVAVSVVAIRSTAALDLVQANGWVVRSTTSVTPSTVPLGFALADTMVFGAGGIPSPTWRQTGIASRWIHWGSAFG